MMNMQSLCTPKKPSPVFIIIEAPQKTLFITYYSSKYRSLKTIRDLALPIYMIPVYAPFIMYHNKSWLSSG